MKKIARPELLIVLFALLVSGLLMSQALKKEKPKQVPQVTEQLPSASSFDETAFLRGQLAEMREYDQRLLATVYWSLSGVFLVVVVIAGLNWFANYRVYERERESLRQEVETHAKLLRSEIEQRFQKLSHSVAITGQKQTEDLSRQLAVEVKKLVAAEAHGQRREIDSLRQQLSRAQFDDTEFRARHYESTDGYRAFELWVENLEHMKHVSFLWDDYYIGSVFRSLTALLNKGQRISYTLQGRLLELMEQVPPIMSADVERLKALLDAAKKS